MHRSFVWKGTAFSTIDSKCSEAIIAGGDNLDVAHHTILWSYSFNIYCDTDHTTQFLEDMASKFGVVVVSSPHYSLEPRPQSLVWWPWYHHTISRSYDFDVWCSGQDVASRFLKAISTEFGTATDFNLLQHPHILLYTYCSGNKLAKFTCSALVSC